MIQGHIVRGLDLKFERLPECEAYIMGKQVQKPYIITENYTVKPLQLIHMDLCGPMLCQSLGGSKYFLVIVDDYSRRIFAYFLRSKDETFERFEEFKARAENELSLRIKDVRTDNGTEFCNSRFEGIFKRSGIHHQLTTTYSPQTYFHEFGLKYPFLGFLRSLWDQNIFGRSGTACSTLKKANSLKREIKLLLLEQFFNWFNEFKFGKTNLEEELRSDRPPTALKKGVRIGSAAIKTIINDHFKCRKLVGRWVPHGLTEYQKLGRVTKLGFTILIQKQKGNLLFDDL
ncbi:hypothetical protein LAZ67_23001169 [Cordylochernes scorpioides]|uniref:Integrase catalytic domain-containing protein n=1 Tax=Cordylochernes scorpioides TaxID=51811 RepID=A0ABY6LRJ5_9ARAC|nr:hypothetical protein LAZ67_23001169 [Cordylochernes scorpioides]